MMMQDMMYRGRSPYMGINSMNRFGMQGQQQAQQQLGGMYGQMMRTQAPQFQRKKDPESLRLQGGPRYNTMPVANQGVSSPSMSPDEMNRRGGPRLIGIQEIGMQEENSLGEDPGWADQPNYPMYGGGGLGGMYGGRMGGMYGGGGYGAGMGGLYGGGMYGGRMGGMYGGGMMPPQRPRPSPYGGGLTSGFGGQMFGANPYQYSQGLGSMGRNWQMNQFPQTGLYNLMAMQQGSFDPYMQYQTDDTDSGGGDTGGGDDNGNGQQQQYGQQQYGQQQYGGFGGYGYGGGYGGLGSMGNYGGGFSPYGGMPTYPQQTPYGSFSY